LEDIENIRKIVGLGKKHQIKSELIKLLGARKGAKIYDEYEGEMAEFIRVPYDRAKKIKTENGLDLYQYPDDAVPEREKLSAKTLLVLGETGSGKSTFLNAIVNYLEDIDIHDSFRYQICVDDSNSSAIKSMTKKITNYYAKDVRDGCVYRIFDTPGFADTEGIEVDYNNVLNIQ
jgi:ribosome biogenesis GTPase A